MSRWSLTLNPMNEENAQSLLLDSFQLLDHFSLFSEDRKGKQGMHDVSVPDVAGLPITGLFSEASRHLLPSRTSLISGSGQGTSWGILQRGTEIALVSSLPNFIPVHVSLFPGTYSLLSPPLPHFFSVVYSTKENEYEKQL